MKPLFLFLFSALFLSSQAKAQFIVSGQISATDAYTDISPDAQLKAYYDHGPYKADTLFIDLDRDGQPDLFIYSHEGNGIGSGGTDVYIHPINSQLQIASQFDTLKDETGNDTVDFHYINSAISFSAHDTINSSGIWNNLDNYILTGSYSLGSSYGFSWPDSVDYFAGMKFVKGQTTSFGWIRIQLGEDNDTLVTTVKDYAINKSVISAVSIPPLQELKIYPNPAEDNILIQLPDATKDNADISLYGSAGNFVSSLIATQTNSGYRATLPNLPNGLYYVKINFGDESVYSKLLIYH